MPNIIMADPKGGGNYPHGYDAGTITPDSDSASVTIQLSKEARNIIYTYGVAEGSSDWNGTDNENWSQGWFRAPTFYAVEQGLLGYSYNNQFVTYMTSSGTFSNYTSGSSININNDKKTVTINCTRGCLFKANVKYNWEIFYELEASS